MDDWQALSTRCGVAQVADNLLSIDAPWFEPAVKDWISQYSWRGTPTYRLAICLKGDLIGAVGFAGRIKKFGFGYFLAPEYWGQGYGTEAARAFLADAFARFDIPAFNSAAFARNAASRNILTKLGFVQVGEGMSPATATLEPEPELRYRLTEPKFKAAIP
ncbi:MAG: GNAT family N-acetyltransferase [Marinosulfonomonas sp.]|nr:GNAT family N-acetyltransferase [Marinosulfonomonas sp.]